MTPGEHEQGRSKLLRQRAEDALRGNPVDLDGLPVEDIQSLLHELQVHQIELSLQNEELRQVQLELETSRDQYSDLYNFAPAGYCTINHKDQILEANQTLADMLNVERKVLIHNKFSHYVDRNSQDEYYLHCQRTFEIHQHEISKISMVKSGSENKIVVQLESTLAHEDNSRLRIMLIDITKQQRMEQQANEASFLRELRRRVNDQREQERQQIARDLHDGPMQDLIAMTFTLHDILAKHPAAELTPQLQSIQTNLKNQIGVLRSYAMELRPPTLPLMGLEKTIRSHAANFQIKHPDIHLHLQMHQSGPLLAEATSLALFRIYQEALTNILKHVRDTTPIVWIRLEKDEGLLRLEIQDNGPGFDLPQQWNDLVQEGHLGMIGMRERAELIGGRLDIYSQPGQGTRVMVTLPLEDSMVQPSSG